MHDHGCRIAALGDDREPSAHTLAAELLDLSADRPADAGGGTDAHHQHTRPVLARQSLRVGERGFGIRRTVCRKQDRLKHVRMIVGVARCRIGVATHHGWAETRMRTDAVPGDARWTTAVFEMEGTMFKKILLGLDGSPESARALELATKIAAEDSAHIEIVHVREFMIAGRAGMQTTRANEEDLEAIVRKQADELAAGGADVTLTVVSSTTGGPAHVLADQAAESGADVIIVGTRGHTGLAGLLLGSVTQRLLHVSPCPVMAVPAPIGAQHGAKQSETAATVV
jgi:nucleotide-binding universal stress UspA family protein